LITVVGAGPVGLVTALLAARAGMEVQVLEQRQRLPIDKACGEGLMPGGVEILRQLDIDIDPDGCSPFRGVRWIDEGAVAEGLFPDGPGLGIRRLHLHRGLWEAVRREGVPVHLGARVTGLSPEGVLCSEGHFASRWILGVDGLHSGMRRLAGLDREPGPRPRFGLRRHYAVSPWTDFVEVHWAPGVEAYVTPVGPDRVGIAFLWSGEKARFDQLLERFPALTRRLEGAQVDSKDLGAGPLHQRVRGVVSDRLALVGDASGYLDALTGEGLSLGFQQAASAIRAIQAGDLRFYAQEHAALVRLPFSLMHLLLFTARHPPLRSRLIRSLSTRPETFGRLLALNDGAPLSSVGLGRLLSVGAGMLVG
jgi:flavin-dependent dehydrogenase